MQLACRDRGTPGAGVYGRHIRMKNKKEGVLFYEADGFCDGDSAHRYTDE